MSQPCEVISATEGRTMSTRSKSLQLDKSLSKVATGYVEQALRPV